MGAGAVRAAPGTLFENSMSLLLDMLIVQMMQERGLVWAELYARHANLE